MSDQHATIVVGMSDALPDVLGRLRELTGGAAAVEIPAGSPLFLTASEFRALQTTAERERVTVTVTTDDPLRQQLAAMFGLPLSTPSTNGGVTPTGGREAEWQGDGGAGDALQTPSNSALNRRWPRVLRASTWRVRTIMAAAAAAVVLLVLAYGAAARILPRATVELTLRRDTISQEFVFAIAGDGDPGPAGTSFTIPVTPVTFSVSTQRSLPTTGVKTIGETVATGTVSLRNPTGQEVTIDAGTEFTSFEGTRFVFAEQVVVPAGTPDQPGRAEAAVRCAELGTVGNRELGMLTGKLPNGIHYSNRNTPIAGGTDRQVAVVAQSDVTALEAETMQELLALAGMATPQGLAVIPATVRTDDADFVFDRRVGEEAATVSVRATASIAALAFDPSALRAEALAALGAMVPSGSAVAPESVRLGQPSPVDAGEDVRRFSIRVEAQTHPILSDADRLAIARAIAGKDEAEVTSYLQAIAAVERFAIRYWPSWLPARIPSSADRIEVTVR